jgi:hypothetical protein
LSLKMDAIAKVTPYLRLAPAPHCRRLDYRFFFRDFRWLAVMA